MSRTLFALSLLGTLATGPQLAATVTSDARAVITQVQGSVTVSRPSGKQPARPLQPLAADATLEVGRSGRAVVICSNDFARSLSAFEKLPIASGCGGGRALRAGTFARLLPAKGRLITFGRGLLEESRSRSDDAAGRLPMLLAPRGPERGHVWVSENRPTLYWAAVAEAIRYELVLEGQGNPTVTLDARSAKCQADPRPTSRRACSHAWPWHPLGARQEVSWKVRALTPDKDWTWRESDVSRLRLVEPDVLRKVESEVSELAANDLPPATRELLRAAIYEKAMLYNEAASALAASFEARPQAPVALALADLYLGLEMIPGALAHYKKAQSMLKREDQGEVRAMVALGLGRVFEQRDNFREAATQFRRAATLFRHIGWEAEAEAAENKARSLSL